MADNIEDLSDVDISQPIRVCSESHLRSTKRKVIQVHDRQIVLFWIRDNVYAMDKHCYHTGGPLELGEIRDIEDTPCVVCPWHKYIIRLQDGEGLYQGIDPHNLQKPPEWKSKGVKQRTHRAYVQDGTVFLEFSDLSVPTPSDYYYSQEFKDMMCIKVPQLPKK